MTNKTTFKFFFSTLFTFFTFTQLSFADASFAKMAAPQAVSSQETIDFFKTKQKTQTLTAEESDILRLASLALDVFEIKDLYLTSPFSKKEEKFEMISQVSIAKAIEGAIQGRTSWDQPLSKTHQERVIKDANLIKKYLGDSSYAWAWIQYQRGDKKQAKATLQKAFEATYDETMKLTHLEHFNQSSPMQQADSISKVLTPLSTESENKSREDQLKKMRLHVSNLPDLQMMT